MVFVETAIEAIIKGEGVTDAGDDVFPEMAPDNAASDTCIYPLIVYDEVESEEVHDLAGNTGLIKSDYMIDCRGLSAQSASKLAKKVRDLLDNECGTFGGVMVKRIKAKKTRSTPHLATTTYQKYYSTEVEAIIWYYDPDVI